MLLARRHFCTRERPGFVLSAIEQSSTGENSGGRGVHYPIFLENYECGRGNSKGKALFKRIEPSRIASNSYGEKCSNQKMGMAIPFPQPSKQSRKLQCALRYALALSYFSSFILLTRIHSFELCFIARIWCAIE